MHVCLYVFMYAVAWLEHGQGPGTEPVYNRTGLSLQNLETGT